MTHLFKRDGTPATPNGKNAKGQPTLSESRKCSRCGGEGGSAAWGPHGSDTGWTCWRCGGNGIDPAPLVSILYNAHENERLDEAQRKREATRARKKAERDEIERQRQERERQEIISINGDLLERIDEELAFGKVEILASVRDYIRAKAKMPSERQVEVVEEIIAKNRAERERLENVAHLGDIGERREFTLKLLYTRSSCEGQFPTIWSHWSLFLDETGSKVACTSAPWTIGLVQDRDEDGDLRYTKGQTVRVKATVKKHDEDKKTGEPITYINRPKLLEIAA